MRKRQRWLSCSASSAADTCVLAPVACTHASIARRHLLSTSGFPGRMPSVDPIGPADRALGRALEETLVWHHRRRLRRLGNVEALRPRDDGTLWCREAPPPADGCAVDIL